jgi:molybdopterin synthase sulfur carrier subunit
VARVLLFGALADVAGWRERETPAQTLAGLREALGRAQPELGDALARVGVQVAVDRALHRGDAALSSTAEVAFLPPMSGG